MGGNPAMIFLSGVSSPMSTLGVDSIQMVFEKVSDADQSTTVLGIHGECCSFQLNPVRSFKRSGIAMNRPCPPNEQPLARGDFRGI